MITFSDRKLLNDNNNNNNNINNNDSITDKVLLRARTTVDFYR